MSFPVVVFNDTRVDLHHGCTRVMSAIESLVVRHGGHVHATIPAHMDWKQNPAVHEAVRAARLVIVNGEGTIHHNSAAGRKLLEVGGFSRGEGVPAVLLNCGWEDNGEAFSAMLRDFAMVAARDHLSAEQMRVSGCRVVPDLSLYLSGEGPALVRGGVGFTDSVIRPVALGLERLRKQCGGKVNSIQHVGSGALATYRFFRSYVGLADLRQPGFLMGMLMLRHQQYRAQVPTAQDYLRQLAGLELLVSGRFHACTLSLVMGTPFVAIDSNSHKIRALVSDAGLGAWRVASALSPTLVAEARTAGWDVTERQHLNDYLPHARAAADALFRDIAGLL